MTAPQADKQPPPYEQLLQQFGCEFPNIAKVRAQAIATRERIDDCLKGLHFPEVTSLVVFGSLARGEWTSGSDIDWTLLIDGPSDAEHFPLVAEVARRMKQAGFKSPGRSEMFGTIGSSHELVHHIGGDDDTNRNMTRRLLLLLESTGVKGPWVRQRVVRAILNRYIVCGMGVPDSGKPRLRVPRFLLNDVVRLWRTFAVDYAAKKWQRSDVGWALRNAKLRIPRKLTFSKGLLLCLDCELLANQPPWAMDAKIAESLASNLTPQQLGSGCYQLTRLSPLDLLARVLLVLDRRDTARAIFSAYDDFLALIDDPEKRQHLEKNVSFENAFEDAIFVETRKISSRFGQAIDELFFDDPQLGKLTRKYGLF